MTTWHAPRMAELVQFREASFADGPMSAQDFLRKLRERFPGLEDLIKERGIETTLPEYARYAVEHARWVAWARLRIAEDDIVYEMMEEP